jgi:hypothetical protein
MIGQYLSNANESATVSILQKNFATKQGPILFLNYLTTIIYSLSLVYLHQKYFSTLHSFPRPSTLDGEIDTCIFHTRIYARFHLFFDAERLGGGIGNS